MELQSFFRKYPSLALGLSGGVDSSYLLYAGRHYGADIHAYFVKTVFQPAFELADARRAAGETGAALTVLTPDILADGRIAENSAERCYYCKRAIFSAIAKQAKADGYTVLADGSNASDDAGDRPGMRALGELAVLSPLRDCGITKARVRALAKEAGLFTHDKPAYACLATRIAEGEAITAEKLRAVERAEDALFFLGFSDFRVRVSGGAARLQFPSGQIRAAADEREKILEALGPLFSAVLLDLKGR